MSLDYTTNNDASKDASTTSYHYDIIIVGAGLVGSALVCCLRSLGLNILLLDHKPLFVCRNQEIANSRPISLAHTSYALLNKIGLWDQSSADCMSLAEAAALIKQVHVSETGGFFHSVFDCDDYNLEALGRVVPACLLQARLAEAASKCANYKLINKLVALYEFTSKDSSTLGSKWRLDFEDHNSKQVSCTADFVVGADGVNSKVRELAAIAHKVSNTGAVAITARLDLDLRGVAFERFYRGGVLALLPQGNKQAGMVWVMSQEYAATANKWDNETWQSEIKRVMRGHLDMADLCFNKVTACYPLRTIMAESQVKSGLALVGNAAHTFYPLAAQGFNISLRDVAIFAELYADIYNKKINIKNTNEKQNLMWSDSDYELLSNDYLDARIADQDAISKITNFLVKSFKFSSVPGLSKLLSCGLLGVDLIPGVKSNLANKFLGRYGKTPRLMRGLDLLPGKPHDSSEDYFSKIKG